MGQLKIYTGDKKQIKQQLEGFTYSSDIMNDLSKQYGLFIKSHPLYFIYSPKDINDVKQFAKLVSKYKYDIICIIEEELDKRSSFYKTYNKQIITLGNKQKQTLDDKVQLFFKDITNIKYVTPAEAVSFLYKVFYNFRQQQYKQIAGECINLVLTGQVKTEQILQVFLLTIYDKDGQEEFNNICWCGCQDKLDKLN